MESREFQNYDDEVTIDLAHFVVSIMKKWKSLVACVLIGAILGGAWYFVSDRGPAPQAEPAKVTAEMQVAALYRSQYEKLQAYIETSPFMALNSEAVVIGENNYYVSKTEDAEQIGAYISAILKDKTTRDTLCQILKIEDEADLDKMIRLNKATFQAAEIAKEAASERMQSLAFGFVVYAENEDQAQQVLDLLHEKVEDSGKTNGFRAENTAQGVRMGSSVELRDMQNKLANEMNNAFKNYTALESKFSDTDKAVYKLYTETGDVSDYAPAVAAANPLKKPVIVAVVFVFLACAWYAVAYLLNGKVKTVDEVAALSRKNILGYINETAPRKCFIDRWLDNLEAHSFPTPVSASYAAAAVAKLGQAVVVYDEQNAELKAVAEKMTGVVSMGLLGQNAQTLSKLSRENQVVLLVKLGATTKMQVQREAALCSQYGISLAGSILVK